MTEGELFRHPERKQIASQNKTGIDLSDVAQYLELDDEDQEEYADTHHVNILRPSTHNIQRPSMNFNSSTNPNKIPREEKN